MTFNMYWLHHSINLLKIVPFLGGWLSDRLLGDPEGWPHPIAFGRLPEQHSAGSNSFHSLL